MNSAFENIKAGLDEALTHAKGSADGAIEHQFTPQDVKAIREKTGLSQREFAAVFRIGLGTLRHWEQGDRQPRGASSVLLKVINKNPRAVLDALD